MIPKIIHQIWIGPKKLGSFLKGCTESWKELHPTWEYIMWDNDRVKSFNFPEKHLLENHVNYGMKSDILRLAILREYGGLYADADIRCLKAFDNLTNLPNHEGFVGKDPFNRNLCNSLIGAKKNVTFLQILLDRISKTKKLTDSFKGTIDQTGPMLLNNVINRYLSNKIRVFPGFYFNGDTMGNPGLYSIHYYAGTWISEFSYERKGPQLLIDKEIRNSDGTL